MSEPQDRRDFFEENAAIYRHELIKQVRRLTGDVDVSEDITQQAFVRYWGSMERRNWPVINNEGAYLWRIAKHAFVDSLKGKGIEFFSIDDLNNLPIQREVENRTMSTNDLDRIVDSIHAKQLLAAIPQAILKDCTYDELIVLYYHQVEDMSFADIAQQTGKSPAYVKRQWGKLTARIRARVASMHASPECRLKASRKKSQRASTEPFKQISRKR